MGAAHSTPTTVTIDNPVEISEEVIQLLKRQTSDQTSDQTTLCQKCTQQSPTIEPQKDGRFWQKQADFDQEEFDKAMEDVDALLGKPVHWSDQYSAELKKFEKELIKCYKKHPEETLKCSNLAKDYQDFVYVKQFESILHLQ